MRDSGLAHNDESGAPLRRLGLLAGACEVADDFDQMGTSEIADLFEGKGG